MLFYKKWTFSAFIIVPEQSIAESLRENGAQSSPSHWASQSGCEHRKRKWNCTERKRRQRTRKPSGIAARDGKWRGTTTMDTTATLVARQQSQPHTQSEQVRKELKKKLKKDGKNPKKRWSQDREGPSGTLTRKNRRKNYYQRRLHRF